MKILTRTAAGLVAGLVLLSGCSAPGGSPTAPGSSTTAASSAPADTSGQSVQDACAALSTAMSEASSTMDTAMQDAGSDPQKAVKSLEAFKDALTEAAAKVDNAEVKAQLQKVVDSLAKLIPLLQASIDDPSKLSDVMTQMIEFQKELSAIANVCAG